MDESQLKIIKSNDGSHTLWRPDLDEHYHSTHGAIQEALHVFIESGLKEVIQSKKDISILEVGFGTGLNAFLTLQHNIDKDLNIAYTGLEAYPLSEKLTQQLNYTSEDWKESFDLLHACEWNQWNKINEGFNLYKLHGKLEEVNFESQFDLVYYDAFGPRAQDSMWIPELFQKVYNVIRDGGVFVTYCAKGQVRRDLESVGFKMERLPGPPGKREMLRGVK